MKTLQKIITISLFTLIASALTGCFSAQKALQKNNYDVAINKSIKKLKKKNPKDKHILILEEAYQDALALDLQTIDYLSKNDLVQNWPKVLRLYKKLDNRQNKVAKLLPLYIAQEGRNAGFTMENYQAKIEELENNVSEYLYRTANVLLQENDKLSSRKAYEVLSELKNLKPNYKDAIALRQTAYNKGKNHILVTVNNRYTAGLPAGFERNLTNFKLNDNDAKWLMFHQTSFNKPDYNYAVELVMNEINVSPDLVDDEVYTDRKKVIDGWEYVLDARGNVKKDSLGNDVKQDKVKWVTCDVIETKQLKEAQIFGSLHIYDNLTKQLLQSIPVSGTSKFKNKFVHSEGDKRALTADSKTKIKSKFKNFPSDFSLLEQATATLKTAVEDALEDNIELVLY